MNDVIKFRRSIESSLRTTAIVTAAALVSLAAVAAVAVLRSYSFVTEQRRQIYVVDKGSSILALQSDGKATRDLEAVDHVTRFHELLFNMAPNSATIQQNVDRALNLSDRSVYDYWSDLSEQGFYQRLVSANISQQFSVDSLVTDMGVYPYRTRTYGKIYLLRESNITAYDVCTSCSVVDVGRSKGNPHGLMIEQFKIESNEKIGTRKRN